MTMHQSIFTVASPLVAGLDEALLDSLDGAQAQSDPDWATQRVWTSPVDVTPPADSTSSPRPRANRIQLFRIVPGFLSDPVGLDSDDPRDATPNDGPDWLQVSMGNYNPYFDIRRPGDPGDVGYYKLHSQIQVFDTGATGLTVALQAVTPAGLDQDGVQDGPTVVSPALSLFHTLDDGTGIQGFIGKNMNLNPTSLSGPIHRNVQHDATSRCSGRCWTRGRRTSAVSICSWRRWAVIATTPPRPRQRRPAPRRCGRWFPVFTGTCRTTYGCRAAC